MGDREFPRPRPGTETCSTGSPGTGPPGDGGGVDRFLRGRADSPSARRRDRGLRGQPSGEGDPGQGRQVRPDRHLLRSRAGPLRASESTTEGQDRDRGGDAGGQDHPRQRGQETHRAYGQIRDLVTTAPTVIHDALIGATARQRVAVAGGLPTRQGPPRGPAAGHQARAAYLARVSSTSTPRSPRPTRPSRLDQTSLSSLLALRQVGPQTAAQLVISAGQNIDRMRSESAFAKLTGVAPLPASSGKTTDSASTPAETDKPTQRST